MRFSCGETSKARFARLESWHRRYAIFPRTVAAENGRNVCVWLGWYERKGTFHHWGIDRWWTWEYREVA